MHFCNTSVLVKSLEILHPKKWWSERKCMDIISVFQANHWNHYFSPAELLTFASLNQIIWNNEKVEKKNAQYLNKFQLYTCFVWFPWVRDLTFCCIYWFWQTIQKIPSCDPFKTCRKMPICTVKPVSNADNRVWQCC